MAKKLLSIFILFFVLMLMSYPGAYILENRDVIKSIGNFQENKISAYVINLNRSVNRMIFISNFLKQTKIPYRRIEAIEGHNIREHELAKVDFESFNKFLKSYPSPGVIGCYFSHIKAWKEFLNSDEEFALILEDDVIFTDQLEYVIGALINHKQDWDIVTLHAYNKGITGLFKKLDNQNELNLFYGKTRDSGAYIINRKAAMTLINYALPMKLPLDIYISRNWEMNLKFFGITTLESKEFGDSEINKKGYNYNIRWLNNKIYNLKTIIMRSLHNLKLTFASI